MEDIKLYDLKDLEELLKVNNRTLLKYIKEDRLKAVKVGQRWIVTDENLRKFLNGEEQDNG